MRAKRKQHTHRDLESEGNLAFANDRLQILQKPRGKTLSPVLRLVPTMMEEYPEDDPLAPTIGIISAFGLSAILWGLIILGVFWIW